MVGEIQGERESEPEPLEERPSGEIRVAGDLAVAEMNETFDLRLPSDDHDTVGGLVFGMLGRIPHVGDEVSVPDGRFRVLAMEGKRITRLAFEPEGRASSSGSRRRTGAP